MKKLSLALIGGLLFASTAFANNIPEPVVQSYMADYNIEKEEAIKRLEIISNSSLISDKLIEKFGDSLIAGVFFEHYPEFKVVVRTTKKGQKARDVLTFANKEMPDLNIEVIPNSPRNFRSIENIINNQFSVLNKKVSGLQSIGYDPAKDEIVITIYDPTAKSSDELQKRYKLDKLAGMPSRIELAITPVTPSSIGGGIELTYNNKGRCTSGFAVTVNGQPGIVTAFHCTLNQTIQNYTLTNGQASYQLTLHPPKQSANHDMAVYLAPKGTVMTSKISLGKGILSEVKAQGKRNALKIGQSYLCHYGRTTGFSCGTVATTNSRLAAKSYPSNQNAQQTPATIDVCNTTQPACNATFISISSSKLNCESGDSGGPVVEANTAYGIVSSCHIQQTNQGQQMVLYLSSLDYLNELSATLLRSAN